MSAAETQYESFVEIFEKLRPHEVDPFCGLLFDAYTQQKLKIGNSRTLRLEELNEMLIHAMTEAQLHIADKRISITISPYVL